MNKLDLITKEQSLEKYSDLKKLLPRYNINPKAIILEPEGKNTAPAISAAILAALNESEKANLIVLSSDHNSNMNYLFRYQI